MFVSGLVEPHQDSWGASPPSGARHGQAPLPADSHTDPPMTMVCHCSGLLPSPRLDAFHRLRHFSTISLQLPFTHASRGHASARDTLCIHSLAFFGYKQINAANDAPPPPRHQWQPLNQTHSFGHTILSNTTHPERPPAMIHSGRPTNCSLFVRKRRNAHLGSIKNHTLAQQPPL